MNSRITAIDDADLLLVIGSNVRVDAPVLNARIRRNQKQGLDVFTIGPSPDLGYNYEHVGSTTQTLIDMANGDHPFLEKLRNAELPMVLVGAGNLTRQDGEALLHTIQ